MTLQHKVWYREVLPYVQQRIRLDVGHVFPVKIGSISENQIYIWNLLLTCYKTTRLLVFRNWYSKNWNATIILSTCYTLLKTYNETSLIDPGFQPVHLMKTLQQRIKYFTTCEMHHILEATKCQKKMLLRGYCTPGQFLDCFCIFLKNYNTLVTSKICFL